MQCTEKLQLFERNIRNAIFDDNLDDLVKTIIQKNKFDEENGLIFNDSPDAIFSTVPGIPRRVSIKEIVKYCFSLGDYGLCCMNYEFIAKGSTIFDYVPNNLFADIDTWNLNDVIPLLEEVEKAYWQDSKQQAVDVLNQLRNLIHIDLVCYYVKELGGKWIKEECDQTNIIDYYVGALNEKICEEDIRERTQRKELVLPTFYGSIEQEEKEEPHYNCCERYYIIHGYDTDWKTLFCAAICCLFLIGVIMAPISGAIVSSMSD